LVVVAMFFL